MRALDRHRTPYNRMTAPDFVDAVPTHKHPDRGGSTYGRLLLSARVLGALAVAAVGAVHLQQYEILYSHIPTIGTLFVLNFVGATAIAVTILAPLERTGGRHGGAVLTLAAVGGIGLAVTSFGFLFISERTPLFGFMEPGYDPTAIAAARGAELATVLLLGGYLIARAARGPSAQNW